MTDTLLHADLGLVTSFLKNHCPLTHPLKLFFIKKEGVAEDFPKQQTTGKTSENNKQQT
jgi:hypothetical protein